MSGIYIKGLKMPDKCINCFFNDIGTECGLLEHDVEDAILRGKRYGGCPLLPVPDHGDLMDRDKFVAEKREQFCADCIKRKSLKTGRFVYEIGDCVCRACDIDDMLDYIEDAPVVIPAERSEE